MTPTPTMTRTHRGTVCDQAPPIRHHAGADSLATVNTAALRLARSEAARDADVLTLTLRVGVKGYQAAGVVNQLRRTRLKLSALDIELQHRDNET